MNQSQQFFLAATLLGAAGLGLVLPRGGVRGRAAGIALGAAGLGLLVGQLPAVGPAVDGIVFYVLAAVTVLSAVATISFRNPVYGAIWFGMTLLGTSGLFFFQGAQFLAVATIVVYAGAILVTFLFVLMLANPKGRAPYDRVSWEAFVSAAAGAVIIGVLSMLVTRVLGDPRRPEPPILAAAVPQTAGWDKRSAGPPPSPPAPLPHAGDGTNAGGPALRLSHPTHPAGVLADEHMARIGEDLFGRHLIAVEVAGTLLLVALVGAAVIVGQAKGPLEGEGEKSVERRA